MKELDTVQLISALDDQVNLFQPLLCLISAGKSASKTGVMLCSNLAQQVSVSVNGGRGNYFYFQLKLWLSWCWDHRHLSFKKGLTLKGRGCPMMLYLHYEDVKSSYMRTYTDSCYH